MSVFCLCRFFLALSRIFPDEYLNHSFCRNLDLASLRDHDGGLFEHPFFHYKGWRNGPWCYVLKGEVRILFLGSALNKLLSFRLMKTSATRPSLALRGAWCSQEWSRLGEVTWLCRITVLLIPGSQQSATSTIVPPNGGQQIEYNRKLIDDLVNVYKQYNWGPSKYYDWVS